MSEHCPFCGAANITIPADDLEVKVSMNTAGSFLYEMVAITHKPTGLRAVQERTGTVLATKTRCMEELKAAIAAGVPPDAPTPEVDRTQ